MQGMKRYKCTAIQWISLLNWFAFSKSLSNECRSTKVGRLSRNPLYLNGTIHNLPTIHLFHNEIANTDWTLLKFCIDTFMRKQWWVWKAHNVKWNITFLYYHYFVNFCDVDCLFNYKFSNNKKQQYLPKLHLCSVKQLITFITR